MAPDPYGLTEVLARDECLSLLREHGFVARLAFVDDGGPQIRPFNYFAEPNRDVMVFCTTAESALGRLADGTPVAVEVDQSRPLYNSGWSVIVKGRVQRVADPAEVGRLARGPLRSWAQPIAPVWVEVPIEEVTGRRIPET
ncbi:MAG TPA: pyridoxamine 5'-phosphate oxidase family protein [Actinomycetota bacterium]|nr:pyridoxamine 5'-phosphate oxidase family protein [Actinomycetota bacterium]